MMTDLIPQLRGCRNPGRGSGAPRRHGEAPA